MMDMQTACNTAVHLEQKHGKTSNTRIDAVISNDTSNFRWNDSVVVDRCQT